MHWPNNCSKQIAHRAPPQGGTAPAPQMLCAAKHFIRAGFISARMNSNGAPIKAGFDGAGNMLPAMFLPIIYIPLAEWLAALL